VKELDTSPSDSSEDTDNKRYSEK